MSRPAGWPGAPLAPLAPVVPGRFPRYRPADEVRTALSTARALAEAAAGEPAPPVSPELVADVAEVLARHGLRPPPERIAAALDRLVWGD